MAVYAIGDVQGCYDPLRRLLDKLRFDPHHDRLWLTGDLVNRGPQSLAVLRFVRQLGAVTVLGNHDLTLLAVAAGHIRPKPKDTTLDEVLRAPDCNELIDWLRHRPLLHHDAELGVTLVHAGLAPQWDLAQALSYAHEVETALRGPDDDVGDFLAQMFGDEPARWRDDLTGHERLRCIVNYCTRMRFCRRDGTLALTEKGAPGSQPAELLPWFQVPCRKSADLIIIFGHWAALGYHYEPGVYALDSACVWGGRLTALPIDNLRPVPISVGCRDSDNAS